MMKKQEVSWVKMKNCEVLKMKEGNRDSGGRVPLVWMKEPKVPLEFQNFPLSL
jgi:hypothetical protein